MPARRLPFRCDRSKSEVMGGVLGRLHRKGIDEEVGDEDVDMEVSDQEAGDEEGQGPSFGHPIGGDARGLGGGFLLNNGADDTPAIMTAFAHHTDLGKRSRSDSAPVPDQPPRKIARYRSWQHGRKRAVARDLGTDGTRHESEHPIAYAVLGENLPRNRSTDARRHENDAPAYQESKPLHRAHIGTGNKGSPDSSGFTSKSYRESQRSLIKAGDVSSAIQLNQLAYAHLPGFQENSIDLDLADRSFSQMVQQMEYVPFREHDQRTTVPVSDVDRYEMDLARRAARTGTWPVEEIERVRAMLARGTDDQVMTVDEND